MDWYFLLVPLLLIPIVLLFVFVGCKLDTESSITTFTPETDVRIFYKADLAARVVSFTATVTVRDAQGKKLGQPGNAATAGANAIDPDVLRALWPPTDVTWLVARLTIDPYARLLSVSKGPHAGCSTELLSLRYDVRDADAERRAWHASPQCCADATPRLNSASARRCHTPSPDRTRLTSSSHACHTPCGFTACLPEVERPQGGRPCAPSSANCRVVSPSGRGVRLAQYGLLSGGPIAW